MGQLHKILDDDPTLNFTGYSHPLFEETARRYQEGYEQHARDSKEKASAFIDSIKFEEIKALGKDFALMDRENWRTYKAAREFLRQFSDKELDMTELNFNLSRIYGMEQSHIHCVH